MRVMNLWRNDNTLLTDNQVLVALPHLVRQMDVKPFACLRD